MFFSFFMLLLGLCDLQDVHATEVDLIDWFGMKWFQKHPFPKGFGGCTEPSK